MIVRLHEVVNLLGLKTVLGDSSRGIGRNDVHGAMPGHQHFRQRGNGRLIRHVQSCKTHRGTYASQSLDGSASAHFGAGSEINRIVWLEPRGKLLDQRIPQSLICAGDKCRSGHDDTFRARAILIGSSIRRPCPEPNPSLGSYGSCGGDAEQGTATSAGVNGRAT